MAVTLTNALLLSIALGLWAPWLALPFVWRMYKPVLESLTVKMRPSPEPRIAYPADGDLGDLEAPWRTMPRQSQDMDSIEERIEKQACDELAWLDANEPSRGCPDHEAWGHVRMGLLCSQLQRRMMTEVDPTAGTVAH